jgi:hypothetical protein
MHLTHGASRLHLTFRARQGPQLFCARFALRRSLLRKDAVSDSMAYWTVVRKVSEELSDLSETSVLKSAEAEADADTSERSTVILSDVIVARAEGRATARYLLLAR